MRNRKKPDITCLLKDTSSEHNDVHGNLNDLKSEASAEIQNETILNTLNPSTVTANYDPYSTYFTLFSSCRKDVSDYTSTISSTSTMPPYFTTTAVFEMLRDIHDKICSTPKTHLDEIRTMTSRQLAQFIITEARYCISGTGDTVAELTEWLDSSCN